MSQHKIAIAICTYDRYDVLVKAIQSAIDQQLPDSDYQILVIDNSPDQDAAGEFGKRYANVSNLTYLLEATPGLSNARNVAAQACDAPFIAYMDDDAIADPGWAAAILEAADAFGDQVAIIGGRVDPIWELERPPWLADDLTGNVSVVDWGGECRIAGSDEWFAGTNITFRVSTLNELGGFSLALGRKGSGASLLSNEESELVDAIREQEGLLVYQPAAKVDHLVEAARLQPAWFRKRQAWQATSDFLMDPERFAADPEAAWQNVVAFINSQEPRNRSMRALFEPTDDPGNFKWQLSAVNSMITLLLAGYDGLDQ